VGGTRTRQANLLNTGNWDARHSCKRRALHGFHPSSHENLLSDNELTSLAPTSDRRSRVAHPLHFARAVQQ
jgi:hypothetical protein